MKNDILKQTLLHYINLEYYANGIDEEFQVLLNKLVERCNAAIEAQKSINTKSSYNLIYKLIKEEVDKFKAELDERMESEAELIMNEELEFLDKTYNKQSESKTESSSKIPLVLSGITLSKVLFAPVDGRDTAEQFVERTGKNILSAYDTSLRAAYSFGQNSKVVTEQVSNKMKQVSRGMQSGIRTAIPGFANNTDREIFLLNNLEVIWVSTLDGRTCLTCASLSGLHFKSIALAPITPHNNCRCRVLPLKDVTEPVPDFEEFVESLSEEEQKHVLGKERYKLWKDYEVELKQFTNNGTVIPVNEINMDKQIGQKIKIQENMKIAKKMFPNETWEEKYKNVFIANSRNPINKQQKSVFEKEFETSKNAAKNSHIIFMLPEKSKNKNPDILMDGELTDIKMVTGNIKTLGRRFVEGMDQGKNVYIQVESDFSIEQIKNKIKGEKKAHNFTDGIVYIYLKGKEYQINLSDL